MAFQFDTSGQVIVNQTRIMWSDLSPFMQGYVEAAFSTYGRGKPGHMLTGLGFSDLAPETLARIIEDCSAFSEAAHVSSAYAGKLFWKDRNWIVHLGVSLPFDNRYGDVLRTFRPLTVSLRDDGKVVFQ